MWRVTTIFVFQALTMAHLTGCDPSTPGERKRILFTPTDCGNVGRVEGCDFAYAIGVGGKIGVQLAKSDGSDLGPISLQSADAAVFTVTPPLPGGELIWEIEGTGAGVARLQAKSGSAVVDFIDIQVQDVTGLAASSIPMMDLDPIDAVYDHYLQMDPRRGVSLFVVPTVGEQPVMGRYAYEHTIVQILDAEEPPPPDFGFIDSTFMSYISSDSLGSLANGVLSFRTPGGISEGVQYAAIFASGFSGTAHTIRIKLALLPQAAAGSRGLERAR